MHHGVSEILDVAEYLPVIPLHWKVARITLAEGDTAYAPGTTKKRFAGTGEIVYYISPTGWDVKQVADTIFLDYIPVAERS